MYPVSDRFLTEIDSNSRKYYWTGTITTKAKNTYEFSNEDIVKGSGYIIRSCCGNSEIELGSVYAAEMGITLYTDIDRYTLAGATVRLYFHLVFSDGKTERIPMGIFEVTEANRNIKTMSHRWSWSMRTNLAERPTTPYQRRSTKQKEAAHTK